MDNRLAKGMVLIAMLLTGSAYGDRGSASDLADTAAEFYTYYENWLQWQNQRPGRYHGSDFPEEIFENENYLKLQEMGPVVVPMLLAHYLECPLLERLVKDTCGLKFGEILFHEHGVQGRKAVYIEEFPDTLYLGTLPRGLPLLRWWAARGIHTQRWFWERWNQYVAYKQQGKEDLAAERLERIGEIGIDALPFLIRLISSGHEELIPIASNVSKRPWASESITLPENATKEQCEAWWNKHQKDYTIPDYNPLDLLRECVKN